jgi:viroplasmin and RNaseH domain-containing protein
MTWYVVYKSKITSVYAEWKDCHKKVNKFSSNSYKGHPPKEQAEASYLEHLAGDKTNRNMKTIVIPFVLIVAAFLVYVIVSASETCATRV